MGARTPPRSSQTSSRTPSTTAPCTTAWSRSLPGHVLRHRQRALPEIGTSASGLQSSFRVPETSDGSL
eukprot:4705636-Alexandrium_andersonii.AAC.1